jgi:hypothetical protein
MSHSELAIAGLFDHEQHPTQRHVADWGGDDVFASPDQRRRFEREPAHEPADVWEPAADLEPEPAASAVAIQDDEPLYAPDRYLEPMPTTVNGRRTVTITGHPGSRAFDTPRRPSRSLDERIAHAPERIAGWAFGLGLLLIIIAIATSH